MTQFVYEKIQLMKHPYTLSIVHFLLILEELILISFKVRGIKLLSLNKEKNA